MKGGRLLDEKAVVIVEEVLGFARLVSFFHSYISLSFSQLLIYLYVLCYSLFNCSFPFTNDFTIELQLLTNITCVLYRH